MMRSVIAFALVTLLASTASGQAPPAASTPLATSPYAPYEFLIGDWMSDEAGMKVRQSFRWGPANSYMVYSTYTQRPGSAETLHFEGIMVWNGRSKQLDYVFAIEPGSGAQEKGAVRVEPNGSLVREVELTAADGRVGQFRQTIWRTGENTSVTSLMRRTESGWVPNFPGSDRIEMVRRTG